MKKLMLLLLAIIPLLGGCPVMVMAGDGVQDVYVLQVIGSNEERFFKPHQELYQLAEKTITSQDKIFVLAAGDSATRADFFGAGTAIYASPENLQKLISQMPADDDDLLCAILSGHGNGYVGDPTDQYYGFSWVPITVSNEVLIGHGQAYLESEFDQWGPRVYGNSPRCLPLDTLGVFMKWHESHNAYEAYGVQFVADIDSLVVGGKLVSDHSGWVKEVRYYLACDLNQNGWVEFELGEGKDFSLDPDLNVVTTTAFYVDICYNKTTHPVLSRLTELGKKNWFFIDRSAGFPRIAVSLNTAETDPLAMPVHGYVDSRGYCQLDLNADGDWDDFVYVNEMYEVGPNRWLKDYELAAMLCVFPGHIGAFFGQCYSGGMHDVGDRSRCLTFSATDHYNTSKGQGYEEGLVAALRGFHQPDGKDVKFQVDGSRGMTLAGLHNACQDYLRDKFSYSEALLRQAERLIARYSYNDKNGYEYQTGCIPVSSPSTEVLVALPGRQPILVNGLEDFGQGNFSQYALLQNYPNPFNSETYIHFQVSEPQFTRICVYNLLGQQVRILVNELVMAGSHVVVWDGRNQRGVALPSGQYSCSMQAGGFMASKSMLLVR